MLQAPLSGWPMASPGGGGRVVAVLWTAWRGVARLPVGAAACYLIMSNKSNHRDELPEAQRRGNGSARAGTRRITTALPAGTADVLTTCVADETQTRPAAPGIKRARA